VWPDERVVRLVSDSFLPARVHVKEDAADFRRFGERYGARWTPTILVLDPDGVERHRIEGFLPGEEFLAQLTLGLGHLAFQAGRWSDAERFFREVVDRFPKSDAAPEALYWAGVSRYKETKDPAALTETARAFSQRYQGTSWATKASVWQASTS
jgi:Tetratricopeptide repeat/Thioredoxin-like domain